MTSAVSNLALLEHIEADRDVLVKVFTDFLDLKAFINWRPVRHSSGQKWLKMPIQKLNNPESHLSVRSAHLKNPAVGLVCNMSHPIIGLDIDGVLNTNPQLAAFLADNPTYQEASPSGKPGRTRLLYRLMNIEDKKLLRPKSKIIPKGQENEIELYNSSGNYITLTGQACTSLKEISFITANRLIDHFPEFKIKPKKVVRLKEASDPVSKEAKASLAPIATWIKVVPADRDHKLTQSFMAKYGYTYYEYWLTGIMSIHYTLGEVNGYSYARQWSEGSADYNELELEAKWRSLSSEDSYAAVTERTYQLFFNECTITWPVIIAQSKNSPIKSDLSNFKVWLKYSGLEVHIDALTKVLFLKGLDSALIPRYYKSEKHMYQIISGDFERLSSRMTKYTAELYFRPPDLVIQGHLKTIANGLDPEDHINRFAAAIQEHTWDGTDRIADIANKVLIRDETLSHSSPELHSTLVRKWLLSLARYFWPEELHKPAFINASCEGMLILSGKKGGINKSSFGSRVFPPDWKHLHVSTKPRLSGAFEDKDSTLKSYTKIVVDYDEAERVFESNSESDLKNEITATEDTFRPPYGRSIQTFKRNYSHLASTNKSRLPLPKEGARRMWWLTVSYVNTYRLDDMDRYQLWAQIRHELTKPTLKAPWLLDPDETTELLEVLKHHRSETTLQIQLEETYAYESKAYSNTLSLDPKAKVPGQYATEITTTLKDISFDLGAPNNAALKHAVNDFLGANAPSRVCIKNTCIIKGILTRNNRYRYYMPPKRESSWEDLEK